MGWVSSVTVAAVLAAAVLGGCQGRTPEEKAVDNATEEIRARADEITLDAERILVDDALGDKDPTTGMGTTYPELVEVPSRDPLTWVFYLHEVGASDSWMDTADVQVGGCLRIVDDGGDLEYTAVRCSPSVQEKRQEYFDVEIDVLTGEQW